MKLYISDRMNDFFYILLYEFVSQTYPLWSMVMLFYIQTIIITIKKMYYIPRRNTFKLYDVILAFNKTIIYSHRLNLDYYNISFSNNNNKIRIIGNDSFLIINDVFYTLKFSSNKYSSYDRFNYNQFTIYLKPITKYTPDECCICFSEPGVLIGLCGHQNICLRCQSKINKCPICNNPHMLLYNSIENLRIEM
jgi:hypothetical protein